MSTGYVVVEFKAPDDGPPIKVPRSWYRMKGTDLERFWARVDRSGVCWTWLGSTVTARGVTEHGERREGYGTFQMGGRAVLAHRASWMLNVGPIPDGLNVLHHCDNPPCVRPDHLFLGTHGDNVHDMDRKGRRGLANRPAGAAHYATKLTEERVRAIRADLANGMTLSAVARREGMGVSAIFDIRRRHTWRHVV